MVFPSFSYGFPMGITIKSWAFRNIFTLSWVNYYDLTATSLEIIVSKGNHPQMALRFRLVKYYNLPRYIDSYGEWS